jgi:hypothetical protein
MSGLFASSLLLLLLSSSSLLLLLLLVVVVVVVVVVVQCFLLPSETHRAYIEPIFSLVKIIDR